MRLPGLPFSTFKIDFRSKHAVVARIILTTANHLKVSKRSLLIAFGIFTLNFLLSHFFSYLHPHIFGSFVNFRVKRSRNF